jgi:PD-(D/E)XK nuclease superfamily
MSLRAGVDVVSNSEISTYLRCAREHYFSYGLKREARLSKAEALTKGLAVHKALGQHHRGERVEYELLAPELRALMRGYLAYWGDPDRVFGCQGTDIKFQIELDHGRILVVGEFDGAGILAESQCADRAILEHKTSSEDISIGSPYWQKVALTDRQLSIYLIASKQLGWGQTKVLYDVLRKPTLRRNKAKESEEEFEERVLEDIIADPAKYYQRNTIVRLEDEHEAHVKDIEGTVRLMQVSREMGPNVPRNVDSCFKWGRPCQFYAVCGTGVDIMNEDYFQARPSSRTRASAEPVPAPSVEESPYVF